MAKSQNGWPANNRALIGKYTVPGTNVNLTLREGDAATVLLYVAQRWDREVEDIDNVRGGLDDWGYAERPIRGSRFRLSNHASGTAMDLNATRHPLGARGTFTRRQVDAIHNILRAVDDVARWGGDYKGRKDPMHVELVGSPAEVGRVAARLRGLPARPWSRDHEAAVVAKANRIGRRRQKRLPQVEWLSPHEVHVLNVRLAWAAKGLL